MWTCVSVKDLLLLETVWKCINRVVGGCCMRVVVGFSCGIYGWYYKWYDVTLWQASTTTIVQSRKQQSDEATWTTIWRPYSSCKEWWMNMSAQMCNFVIVYYSRETYAISAKWQARRCHRYLPDLNLVLFWSERLCI